MLGLKKVRAQVSLVDGDGKKSAMVNRIAKARRRGEMETIIPGSLRGGSFDVN